MQEIKNVTKLSKHITKCAALKKAHSCTSNNYANYKHACWHVSVCRPTQFTNSHTLLHCAVFHYKSCDHMSALWNRALWRTLRLQRLKGTSDIINASQTSENNCTAYVRRQNNWTCALTLAFTKCFKSFFFFAYPVDSYVREALQDIAGCTLQSWGHMTLHLDSHMAAHSRARKSVDRILQWDTRMHKRLRWCAVSNQISWIPSSSRSLTVKDHRQPPKLFFFYTLIY